MTSVIRRNRLGLAVFVEKSMGSLLTEQAKLVAPNVPAVMRFDGRS